MAFEYISCTLLLFICKMLFRFMSDATGDTNLSWNAFLITALNRVNTSCPAFIMHMESSLYMHEVYGDY